jgi:hypothetical protein
VTARDIFRSSDGQYRALWRILAFLGLVTLVGGAITLVLSPFASAADRFMGVEDTLATLGVTIALIIAHVLMLKKVEHRPWSYVWLDRIAARPGLLGFGAVLGATPIAIASLVLIVLGWLAVQPSAPGSWLVAALKMTWVLGVAAVGEELFSRGYMLAAMADGMGMRAAVLVSSLAFGLVHLGNPGVTAQPVILVTLGGFQLAAVLLATRSLYAATAAHLAWNWVMAVPLHVAVSGIPVPHPGYKTVDAGPDWATGGAWGPEGGAFAAAGIIAVIGYLYFRRTRTPLT